MSRPRRIEYEDALYHLLSRGNERSDIFIDEKDSSGFLEATGDRQTIWVELFGGQSRSKIEVKSKLPKDRQLRTKFDQLNSLFTHQIASSVWQGIRKKDRHRL